jgi:hypothetical protein
LTRGGALETLIESVLERAAELDPLTDVRNELASRTHAEHRSLEPR